MHLQLLGIKQLQVRQTGRLIDHALLHLATHGTSFILPGRGAQMRCPDRWGTLTQKRRQYKLSRMLQHTSPMRCKTSQASVKRSCPELLRCSHQHMLHLDVICPFQRPQHLLPALLVC